MHSALVVRVGVSESQTLRDRIGLEAEYVAILHQLYNTAEINTRSCVLFVYVIDEPGLIPVCLLFCLQWFDPCQSSWRVMI